MILNLYITQKKIFEEEIQRDLILHAKNTNILDCFFYNEDDLLVDITGSELYFMVKEKPSDEDTAAKINKKIIDFTSAQGGEAEIELTSDDCKNLLGNYIYAIKIKYNSKFYTLAEGNVCFRKSIIGRES